MLRFLAVFLCSFDKPDRSQLRIFPSDTAQTALMQLVIDHTKYNETRKAIEKRELICAGVDGGSKVPLGFVSLVENVVTIAMRLARNHSRFQLNSKFKLSEDC